MIKVPFVMFVVFTGIKGSENFMKTLPNPLILVMKGMGEFYVLGIGYHIVAFVTLKSKHLTIRLIT